MTGDVSSDRNTQRGSILNATVNFEMVPQCHDGDKAFYKVHSLGTVKRPPLRS